MLPQNFGDFLRIVTRLMRNMAPMSLFVYCALLCSFLAVAPRATVSAAHLNQHLALRNVFEHNDQCYNDSFVWIPEHTEQKEAFSVISSTKQCADVLRNANVPDELLENCPPGLVEMTIEPIYVAKSQISYPYANLNITVTAHSSVETIAFRLECLSAADGSDVYCSDSKAMYFGGVKEWPCRAMTISDRVKYPVRFAYSCFRLTPFSVYAINATILPQKCRLSSLITAPAFTSLFPDALVDSAHSSKNDDNDPMWAPTLSVDLTDDSGIWIHLGKAKGAECDDRMLVNVYLEHQNDSSRVTIVDTFEIKCPDTSYLWQNMEAGRYLLTAYVPIRGCRFMCSDSSTSSKCRQCPRTHLTLDIPQHRLSLAWDVAKTFRDHNKKIIIGCAVTIVAICIAIAVYFCREARKKKAEAKRILEVQLSLIVRPMVIYSDDTLEHRQVVTTFVDCLRNCANCQPVFDMEHLISPEPVPVTGGAPAKYVGAIVPSRWLLDELSTQKKFVIVMSECAVKLLNTELCKTHHLVTVRPFADMFGPALEIIMRDAVMNSAKCRNKYCIVKFSYSPDPPANLALLGFPVFDMPAQFAQLTAFLHNLEEVDEERIAQNLPEDRCQKLADDIKVHTDFCEEHPDWIDLRFRVKEDPTFPMISTKQRIAGQEVLIEDPRTYGVEPPTEEEIVDDQSDREEEVLLMPPERVVHQQFHLLPPDHLDSDVENDDSSNSASSDEEAEPRPVQFEPDNLF